MPNEGILVGLTRLLLRNTKIKEKWLSLISSITRLSIYFGMCIIYNG